MMNKELILKAIQNPKIVRLIYRADRKSVV